MLVMIGSFLLRTVGCVAMLLALMGCQNGDGDSVDSVVAHVGDRHLSLKDIPMTALGGRDSSEFVSMYTNNWVLEELMLLYADEQASLPMQSIDDQVHRYRKALIRHALETQYIDLHLDNEVSEEEIAAAYELQSTHFVLNEDILRVLYVKVLDRSSSLRSFSYAT